MDFFIRLKYKNDIKKCEDYFGKVAFKELYNKYRKFWICLFKCDELDYFLYYVRPKGKVSEYQFFEAVKLYYFTLFSDYDELNDLIRSEFNLKFIETNDFKNIKKYNKHKMFRDINMQRFVSMLGKDNILRLNKETGLFDNQNFFEKFVYYFTFDSRIYIKNYDEARDYVVEEIRKIKKNRKFSLSCNYEHVHGDFFKKYPDLFIRSSAPYELRKKFYDGELSASDLYGHPEYIEYLKSKDLLMVMRPFNILIDKTVYNLWLLVNKKYANEKILELFVKYYSNHVNKIFDFSGVNFDDFKEVEIRFKEKIYKNLISLDMILPEQIEVFLQDDDFMRLHPELELDFDGLNVSSKEKDWLKDKFYRKIMTLNDLREYPELLELLLDKNILELFNIGMDDVKNFVIKEGKFKFLRLASVFGNSLLIVFKNHNLEFYDNLEFIDEVKYIEQRLAGALYDGDKYKLEDLPEFFKKKYSDLVLSDDASEELKEYFYGKDNTLTFDFLKEHPEWLKYLDGKDVQGMFKRCSTYSTYRDEIDVAFQVFKDFRIGVKYAEVVDECIKSYQAKLLRNWWIKTNKKFFPDFAVVSNLTLDADIDKFLNSTSWWKKLIKLGIFDNEERKSGILKMAYIFGVFDKDPHGFQWLYQYFSLLPIEIKCSKVDILTKPYEYKVNPDLRKLALEEGFSGPTIYEYSGGTYKLTFDPRKYPKFSAKVRSIMGNFKVFKLLSTDDVHRIFGGMRLTYNKDFYEFLLAHWEKLFDAREAQYIVPIQKAFKKIQIVNRNRKLTWEIACSFVDKNKYEVNFGNEQLLDVASKAALDPDDMEKLEEIYEEGKKRVCSTIPRVLGSFGNINYEITRLDDPLPLGIGELTDCCQTLDDNAETCMVHSMTTKNGRLFVVRNDEGAILAQSWVWRNEDVICFDNIEVPYRVLDYEDKSILTKILKAYREASKKLVVEDPSIIKVTVGLGYNDIADLIEKSLPKDYNPVRLKQDSYIYLNDSVEQYIFEINSNVRENENKDFYDDYLVCDKDNFPYPYYQNIIGLEYLKNQYSDFEDFEYDTFFEDLDKFYETENLKIVMNANFVIIFRYVDNVVEIYDIICGDLVDYVKAQINLALKQISLGKNISCKLDENDMDIYKKVIGLETSARKRLRY